MSEAKVPAVAAWGEGCSDIYIEHYTPKKIKRLILLNAMVLPKKPMIIVSEPTTLNNVKALISIAEKVESYIGHESTAKLLSELLSIEVPMNRAEYDPQRGDVAVVARLKRRLQAPQDVKDVRLEDIEFHLVVYEEDRVREEPPTFIIYTLPG
jgi:hypothetical protein